MATEAVVPKPEESAVEAPKAAYVKKMYSPEFLAEQEAIDKRVREDFNHARQGCAESCVLVRCA